MKQPVYIYAKKDELETPEFAEKLDKAYAEKTNFEEIYLVVDGQVLEDPNNGGALKKIGKNLYQSALSKRQFKLDNGDIDCIKGLSEEHPSGLHELRDPNSGMPLKEVEEGIYEMPNGKVYIAANDETLESPEFNEKLQDLYKKHNLYGDKTSVNIVLNGETLEDPTSGGTVIKTGPNEYKGVYSKNTMLRANGELLPLRDPVAGTRMVKQEDGRYYSSTLNKHFTLGEAQNGKAVFFPEYLPYDGMTNVKAQVIGDRLVGENGISLPILETGYIDGPMEDGLLTQEDIDASIAKKHELNEKALNKIRQELDEELAAKKAEHEAEMAKMQQRIDAIKLARELETARVERKAITEGFAAIGLAVDPDKLPPLPEIPDDMPLDLLQEEIDSLRALMNNNNKQVGSLDFRNVQALSLTASANETVKASKDLEQRLDIALNPDKEFNAEIELPIQNEEEHQDDKNTNDLENDMEL